MGVISTSHMNYWGISLSGGPPLEVVELLNLVGFLELCDGPVGFATSWGDLAIVLGFSGQIK